MTRSEKGRSISKKTPPASRCARYRSSDDARFRAGGPQNARLFAESLLDRESFLGFDAWRQSDSRVLVLSLTTDRRRSSRQSCRTLLKTIDARCQRSIVLQTLLIPGTTIWMTTRRQTLNSGSIPVETTSHAI
ncbi:MAG: hypothetical protein IID46_15925 [Planctomycetes bacterium]|nr:hypothetical protein [Planctomycetota bacterium]